MKKSVVILLALVITLASCGGGNRGVKQTVPGVKKSIEQPVPPMLLTSEYDRGVYRVERFWDKFDFSDTTFIASDVLEQAIVDYIYELHTVQGDLAKRSISKTMESASVNKHMYLHFAEMFDKYLYDGGSPMRNEETYIPVLESVMAQYGLANVERIRYKKQLENALKNRLGEKVANIEMTDAAGRRVWLHSIRANHTLIYFNNPDCAACRELTREIMQSPMLSHRIESGEIKMVMLYIDSELEAWRNVQIDVPSGWGSYYDASFEIRDNKLYHIPAIPAIYILDKDKVVVKKDLYRVDAIERYFSEVTG